MIFNEHSDLEGSHAFLSPSRHHWMNYSEEKLERVFKNYYAAREGTRKHAFACEAIRLGMKLSGRKSAVSRFVNDSIGWMMTPEQMLVYSLNCYGTADAISFRDKLLRINELKTGEIPAGERQTMGYAAIFCLEYDENPHDIDIKLAIYQGSEPYEFEPNPDDIAEIMETIVRFDPILDRIRKEMLL